MAKAGFCSSCGQNVYLDPDGSCPAGHGPECISGHYEVAEPAAPSTPVYTPPPVATPAPAYTPPPAYAPQAQPTASAPQSAMPPATPPKKKRTGLVVTLVIVALLLLCGCGAGAYFLFKGAASDDGSSSGKPAKTDPEKLKTLAAWGLMKGLVYGDLDAIQSHIPSDTVAAVPQETWDAFAESAKSEGVVFKSETWDGPVLTVTSSSPTGDATTSVTPSVPDASRVEITTVHNLDAPATITMKLENQGGTWKVVVMSSPGGSVRFDKEGFLEDLAAVGP